MKKQRMKHVLTQKTCIGLILSMLFSGTGGVAYAVPPNESGDSGYEGEFVPEINENGEIPGYAKYLKSEVSDIQYYSARSNNQNSIASDYIEAVVADNGRFSVGNRIGREDTTYDDNQILIYGHPWPDTSYTTVFIDGEPHVFSASAELSYPDEKTVVTSETISGIDVTQTLRIVSNTDNGKEDTVNISYEAKNADGGRYHTVGFRIMLDTMLGDNDGAPFKVPGIGDVTTELELTGNQIPQYWQAYDSLEDASVFAVGTFYNNISERPDKVQFAAWPEIVNIPGQYTVTEGKAVTNDSAVAIYWNEQSLYAGGVMSVNTSYGVGYADVSSSMNQEMTIPHDRFGVKVTDVNGQPISGAAVSVAGHSMTTDNNGLASMAVSSDLGSQVIKVRKDGYSERSMMADVYGGKVVSIALSTDFTVTSVFAEYDGKKTDLLSSYLMFNEYKEKSDRDSTNDRVSKLVITAEIGQEIEGASYQIVQGLTTIAESNTPSFTFDVYEFVNNSISTYREPALQDFTAGKEVELLIFSNGRRIGRKKLGIKVLSPSSYIDGTEELELGFQGGITLTVPEDVPIFGNSELNLGDGLINLPLYLSISNNKIQMGYNMPEDTFKKTFVDNANKKHEYYKALEKAEKGDYSGLEKFLKKKRLKYGQGAVDGSIEVVGYGEAAYVSDGRYDLSLEVHIYGKINGEYTYQTFVSVVPVYVKVEGEGKLGFDGSAGAQIHIFPDVRIENVSWDLDIKPSISFKLSAGAGFNGILSAGVGGGLSLDFLYKLKNQYAKADLTGSVFLEAYVSPLLHYEKTFAQRTWNLYDGYLSRERTAGEVEPAFDMFDIENYEMVSLEDIEPYSETDNFEDIILDDEALRGNTLKLLKDDSGKMYAFYLGSNGNSLDDVGLMVADITVDKDGSVNVESPDRLVSIASDSNAMKPSTNSDARRRTRQADDGEYASTPELYYDTYQDGDKVYIAMAKSDQVSDDLNMLKASDIYVAVFDMKTTSLSSMERLTDNDKIDVDPVIYHDRDGMHVAWISIEPPEDDDLNIFSENAEYTIHLYDEKSGRTESKNIGKHMITGLAVGKAGSEVVAVYSADTDGLVATVEDIELFAFDGSDVKQITDDEAVDSTPQFRKADNVLMWYKDGEIYETDNIRKSGHAVVDLSSSVSYDFRIIEGNGKTLIAWEGLAPNPDKVSNKVSIYAVEKNRNGWSGRFILYRGEDYVTSSIDGYIDSYGPTLLHMNTGNIFEDENAGSAIILSRNLLNTNLTIEAVNYDTDDVELGNPLPLSVLVRNNGNTTVKEVAISVDGEVIKTSSENLAPGEEKEIKVREFIVPELKRKTRFEVYVEATEVSGIRDEESSANGIWELDESDNVYNFELGYTDLMVDTGIEIINEEDYLVVTISNPSYMPSGANLKVLADSADGVVLADQDIETISARSSQILKFRLQDIAAGANLNRIIASIRPTVDELITENNVSSIFVSDSITRYYLNVSAGEGGSVDGVSGSYKAGDIVQLQAIPYEGYRFARWDCSVENIIASINSMETTLQMPEQDVHVTAVFEKIDPLSTWDLHVEAGEGGSVEGTQAGAYAEGTEIHLTAVPDAGYRFTGWSSDVDHVIDNVTKADITFSMPGSQLTVKAEFARTDGSGNQSGSRTGRRSWSTEILLTMHGRWIADGTAWKFLQDSGSYAQNRWGYINGEWYYFDAEGYMVTGWHYINNQWYYMNPDEGSRQGVMMRGWIFDSSYSSWFYLNESGAMLADWNQIGGKWYYLNPVSDGTKGAMASNSYIDGFYVGADGAWIQ